LGVGVWASVQRPRWVPMISLTESDLRISFYLRSREDRSRMDSVMGDGVPWDSLQKTPHSFVAGTDSFLSPTTKISLQKAA
ncbi:MAG: hypothetical protein ACREQ5_14035, partial [Candidatus Dormibacteria bacterium]